MTNDEKRRLPVEVEIALIEARSANRRLTAENERRIYNGPFSSITHVIRELSWVLRLEWRRWKRR